MAETPTNLNILHNISVDCVIFGYDRHSLKVLLKREDFEHEGHTYHLLKLPGNHILHDETIEDTTSRILLEQTGLHNIYVKKFNVFSSIDRLTRNKIDYQWVKPRLRDERVLTIGFYSLIDTDIIKDTLSETAFWCSINEVGELIFDHNEIFNSALSRLRQDLLHEPVGFELLPTKFTLTDLQLLYEAIFNTQFDKRNFRRRVGKMKYLIPLNQMQTGVSHKPARYYTFHRELYEESRSERFDFRL